MQKMEREKRNRLRKLFNFRPVLFVAVSLALGVFSGYSHLQKSILPLFLSLIFMIGLLLFSKGKFFFFAVMIFSFSLGFSSFSLQVEGASLEVFVEGRYEVKGCVYESTLEENGCVYLENLTIGGKENKGKMRMFLEDDSAKVGDVVRCTAQISTISPYDKNSYTFGRMSEKLYFTADEVEEFFVVDHRFDLFDFLRSRLKDRLHLGMDEETASVLYAVLTGDTTGIEEGLLTNVRHGGIAHIFAVSGLHVGALYGFCVVIVSKIFKSKQSIFRLLIPATVLLFYGGFCGYSPSVVRAIMMCLTFSITEMMGLKGDSLERISLALIFVLLLQPTTLFTVGFLLSFGACYSIILFTRPIQDGLSFLARRPLLQKAVNLFAVSLAAQIGTLPVLLYYFGYISALSLLLNLLFVPLISLSFPLFLLVGVAVMALPKAAAPVLLYLPYAVISLFLLLFHAVDFTALSWKGEWQTLSVVAYFVCALLWTDKLSLKKRCRWIGTLCCALLFVAPIFL